MIFNSKNKFTSLFVAALMITVAAKAQELKTTVSAANQFKNNAVPGLKYAASADTKPKMTASKPYEGSSLAHDLKTGTTQTAKFAPGTGTTTSTATSPTKNTQKVFLPSNMTPEQAKAANEKETKKIMTPAIILQEQTKPADAESIKKQLPPVKAPSQEEAPNSKVPSGQSSN